MSIWEYSRIAEDVPGFGKYKVSGSNFAAQEARVMFGLDVDKVVIADFVLAAVGDPKYRNSGLAVVAHFDLRPEWSVYQLADQILVAQRRHRVSRRADAVLDKSMQWLVKRDIGPTSEIAPAHSKRGRVGA